MMTREEIVREYEAAVAAHAAAAAAGIKGAEKSYQLFKAGLSALRPVSRERVEQVWRGEWKPTESPYMNECEDCSVCGYRTPWGHGFRFCPACGAAQTDEAVDMVMEKINNMEEMTNEH